MRLAVIILAAGKGTRMKSALPKVLHPVGGLPMLGHVVNTAHELEATRVVVVYGHGGERVQEALADRTVDWVLQEKQLGTGHAVAEAVPHIQDCELALVLYGDVPLVLPESVKPLLAAAASDKVGMLTVRLANPTGYGRIVRGQDGTVQRIVEEKDASPAEKAIVEGNTGILACPVKRLGGWVERLDNSNAQGEFYLTDVVAMAVADGVEVDAFSVQDEMEVSGANDRVQLARLERAYQRRRAEALMLGGASMADPARVEVRGEVTTGNDCQIDVNVVFEGRVVLGEGVSIGPNCVIRDSRVDDGARILANCVLEGARVGQGCTVGPFARLRPEAELAASAQVGNFVEIKKSTVGPGSKVNHLTYIGDARIGSHVNVGAGTITCNYDGVNKHPTVIGDGAFVGSNSSLVAPVNVGEGAVIGAGSTVSREVPAGKLTISRARQRSMAWKKPSRES